VEFETGVGGVVAPLGIADPIAVTERREPVVGLIQRPNSSPDNADGITRNPRRSNS